MESLSFWAALCRVSRKRRTRAGQHRSLVTTIDRVDVLTDEIAQVLAQLGVTPSDRRPTGPDEDAILVTIPTQPGPVTVPVEIKWRSQPLGVAEAAHWQERHAEPTILALPSIPRGLGAHYRALGINYVDSGGNAYLDFPGFHVHIEGQKPRVTATSGTKALPASTNPAGLKVVFVLLITPDALTLSHDNLARMAGVSKGTVTNTLADLRRRGHVFGERNHRTLVDRDRLARDWVDGYVRDLTPRLKEVQLAGPEPDWWTRNWTDTAGTIGGGLALAHLGAPLRPDRTVIYGVPPWPDIRRQARLTRDTGAPVTLRERFWSADFLTGNRYIPPLLAYADALASTDPREAEAARELASLNNWTFAR
jgi:hypothetical protein